MKRNFTLGLLAVFILLVAAFQAPPDDLLQRIYDQLARYTAEQPYEKVYLHLDKEYYAAGDDIWFRAYLVEGMNHLPSPISRILYVEFLDPTDEVLSQLRLRVDEGVAVGDFHLSDSLIAGTYRIRAYTNWMINQGPDYFFERELPVSNSRLESISFQVDYDWKRVKGGDSLFIQLQIVDLERQADGFKDVDYVLKSGGKTIRTSDVRIGSETGNRLRFFLPDQGNATDKPLTLEVETTLGDKVLRDIILMGQKPYCADLQFFPEGGDLVAGIASRVAFKAVDQYGKGFDIEGGVLLSSDHQQLATFSSSHLGMGVFQMKPESGKTYYTRVEIQPGGNVREFSLPDPIEEGYTLEVNGTSPEKLQLRISRTANMPQEVVLTGHVRGDMPFVIRAESPKESFVIPVPRNLFSAGLIHFTLFDLEGRPQAERLAYNPGPEHAVLVLPENDSFGFREHVEVLVRVQNIIERPVPASLSISVINETVHPSQGQHSGHIRSCLLLSSDLKGPVEQPGYYFDPAQADAPAALDLLLMTQGWRRFAWKDVLSDEFPEAPHLIEQDLFISGKVLRMFGKPARNGSVQLSMFQDSGFVHIAGKTDEEGRFYFQEDFWGDRMAVLQGQTKSDNRAFQFELDPVPSAPVPLRPADFVAPQSFDPELRPFLENSFRRADVERAYQLATGEYLYELEPIMIRASANRAETRLLGQNYSDHLLTSDDLDFYRYSNVFELIRSRFPGVLISQGAGGQYGVLIRGFRSITGNNFALIVIDGVPSDADMAASIFPGDIESIEVIKGPKSAIYGLRGGNGVVVITTKKGNQKDKNEDDDTPGVLSFLAHGYYAERTFYSPRYDTPLPEHALPDLRSTVYWNPVVTTDDQGNARISFYTADQPGTYRIRIEGLGADGVPVMGNQTVMVKEVNK